MLEKSQAGFGTFWLRFTRLLEDPTWHRIDPGIGSVAFHRWLPDGESDALRLPIDWKGDLKVWFERCGAVDERGFVRFDEQRREIDATSLRRQAVVFSGPLHGRLVLPKVEAQDLAVVREGTERYEEHQRSGQVPFEAEYYPDFGKRIAKIIGPPLARFFDFVRYNYGQYWIDPFPRWDSRSQHLGTFFHSIFAKWSADDGRSWRRFYPTMPKFEVIAQALPWEEFLSEKDWRDLGAALQAGYETGVAAKLVSRANRFLDEDDVVAGLVESVTALEVAMRGFLNRRLDRSGVPSIPEFKEISRSSQLKVVLAIIDPPVDLDTASQALKAVDQRNKFIHEGVWPTLSAEANAKAVLRLAARLLQPPGPKLPMRAIGSRMLYPPESA